MSTSVFLFRKVARLKLKIRNKCLELFKRLHEAGFSQGSPHMRNILVQAGPLWKPQELRSMDTPSFRLIDFGPGTRKEDEDGLNFAKTVELEEYAERCALPHPAPSEWTLRGRYWEGLRVVRDA